MILKTLTLLAVGTASYYNLPGSWMADGHIFEPYKHVCAMRTDNHKSLVEVVNRDNGRMSWCITEDYGPAAWTGRVIDLSPRVKDELGFYPGQGLAPVRVYLVDAVPTNYCVRF